MIFLPKGHNMKQLYFIIAFLYLTWLNLFAQDFSAIDERIKDYPQSFSNPEKLAELLYKDFEKPAEKARAIYTWIALNIEYDTKSSPFGSGKTSYSYKTPEEKQQIEQKIRKDLAIGTLRKKRAVCEGYATLYKYLCDLNSIECEIIRGTAKIQNRDIGKIPEGINHSWNAVKIDDDWKLIDVTWGAGYIDIFSQKFVKEFSDIFFFGDPELFFLNHFPENPDWLFVDKTARDFAELPLYYPGQLHSRIEIVEPRKGIIKVRRNNAFEIILNNSDNAEVGYVFSNDKYLQKTEPMAKNGSYYYKITPGNGRYLTIFINSRAFVSYKIE